MHSPLQIVKCLKDIAEELDIKVGVAVSGKCIDEARYQDLILREFNMIVPENEIKLDFIQPEMGKYDFSASDKIVDFAKDHGLFLRGTALMWYFMLPSWLNKGNFSRADLVGILDEYITTVVGRYKGTITEWDVVNEGLALNVARQGKLQKCTWLDIIGPEYIELAFQYAHKADPSAKLFYNENACEAMNKRSDAVYNLVKELIEKQIPVHGVGFQSHFGSNFRAFFPKFLHTDNYPDYASIEENVKRFVDLGLYVSATEMDVSVQLPSNNQKQEEQARIYGGLVRSLVRGGCKTFVTWGVSDARSWIPAFFPGFGSPLLFDENFLPKPAYHAFKNALISGMKKCV